MAKLLHAYKTPVIKVTQRLIRSTICVVTLEVTLLIKLASTKVDQYIKTGNFSLLLVALLFLFLDFLILEISKTITGRYKQFNTVPNTVIWSDLSSRKRDYIWLSLHDAVADAHSEPFFLEAMPRAVIPGKV